ncbi:hypothetical protein PFICI_09097 [Pestalotiopsis fici W106-1]|uniref:Uncharacterized protein n=1 Tax=Pestalotiopsis fici (strain W106-1 / CGMCC3.15140) TaxID=1229662 RepID=W3WZQ7_PESFW|nr:uncharacterized protein PFICI_09097 [Pestalotiopsis fici W106-1]ETS79244.1 hypothetical protein PFICI_09097 [Pestalotiopsis fici W106-1]
MNTDLVEKGLGTHSSSPVGKDQFAFFKSLVLWSTAWAVDSFFVQMISMHAMFRLYDRSINSALGWTCISFSILWFGMQLFSLTGEFPGTTVANLQRCASVENGIYITTLFWKNMSYGLALLLPLTHMSEYLKNGSWAIFHSSLLVWFGCLVFSLVAFLEIMEWPNWCDMTFTSYQFVIWGTTDLYVSLIFAILIPLQILVKHRRDETCPNHDPEKACTCDTPCNDRSSGDDGTLPQLVPPTQPQPQPQPQPQTPEESGKTQDTDSGFESASTVTEPWAQVGWAMSTYPIPSVHLTDVDETSGACTEGCSSSSFHACSYNNGPFYPQASNVYW